MIESEQAAVLLSVVRVLADLGVSYHVGGSIASSIHGIPRFTQDVDLVAQIREKDVVALVSALKTDFYIDAGMIQDAIQRRSSFNIIHLESLNKVDVFVSTDDARAARESSRRVVQSLEEGAASGLIYVSSPEDTILRKLEWFRMGGAISDRQWSDILGVLKVQGESLDRDYLQLHAAEAGLSDLLERAVEAAAVA